ncbi:hypothetical protein ZOSMA_48G00550 [Zostera marina]|uniref:Uncharacterized protein n=1 Tax=Zostera marina TaxID=29655 RepID=A0A0K9P1R7_ZOSMR|nr:hypothetical protein ZOSMA_48G00550 [Zostera marina]
MLSISISHIFLWEHPTLFRVKSPRNHYIFQRFKGIPKKKNRTIASLSNNEVSEFPLSYKSYGPLPEV